MEQAMKARPRWQLTIRRLFQRSPIVAPLATLLFVFVLFSVVTPNFATWRTFSGIVNAVAISGVVTAGVTMLMIAGEFDLSVAAMLAMGGFLYASVSAGVDCPITRGLARLGVDVGEGAPLLGLGLAIAVPALLGLINGLLLNSTGIPSFIVTLGTGQIYRGLVWLISGGMMIQTMNQPALYDVLNGRFDTLNKLPGMTGANFRTSTFWLLGVVILLELLLEHTNFGNFVYSVGGNAEAAGAQGVRAKRVKLVCFVITGIMAGLAGAISFSQFRTVRVAEQAGLELTAIAASVVGGALLNGGRGSIWGALIGILMISVLRSGVILMNIPFIPADNFPAVIGLTIIAAVILNNYLYTGSSS